MCPDRICPAQREFALRVRTDDSRVGDVEIRRETLDKTTCPVPVPCPVPALTGNHVRSRARSASPKPHRVQRSPWSTRAWLLLSLEGRASQPAAKHVAIFIQPQNGDLNKIDFLRGRSRFRLSHGQKYGDEIAEHCEKPRQGRPTIAPGFEPGETDAKQFSLSAPQGRQKRATNSLSPLRGFPNDMMGPPFRRAEALGYCRRPLGGARGRDRVSEGSARRAHANSPDSLTQTREHGTRRNRCFLARMSWLKMDG
jgi:hypothetical protein